VNIPFKNQSLHPIMSASLGNYEAQELRSRSGPGEGGMNNRLLKST
jgi:hypothetical protein